MRKIYIARMFVVAILLFTIGTRSLNAQTSVTLGVTTRTGTTGLPFVIAEEKGFFKSEGLNGVVVVMQNQVVVNGVTGKMAGEYPKSFWKIALLVLLAIVAVLIFLTLAQE